MPLKAPFETSFGRIEERDFILVQVEGSGHFTGYGEVTVMAAPLYSEETVGTAWHILEEFLVPQVVGKNINEPTEVKWLFQAIRGNNMAKAGLETAIWDLLAKERGFPLSRILGGTRAKIPVGISLGIEKSVSILLERIEKALAEGYQRIKVKIKPGWDVRVVQDIRKHFGSIPLMVDANSAYTLADVSLLKQLDDYDLMMIEQPLAHDDLVDHARLQRQLRTPLCLDESIRSAEDARKAIELGSCRYINIKIGRVGGLAEAKAIHDLCQREGIGVWCGGMLESGVGRAHNIALTTLPNFIVPGDTSASSRYWHEDIIDPEVTVSEDGFITVSRDPGIGYRVLHDRISKYTRLEKIFRN
ncbi:O-succinylbenzoate synthase [Calderihabitans maritimus]|uniref:o-succinylbenzoate synthase n=2 Tax=Calderihabitans maritimus TaxID=1246530 RepID=A0A1Z5HQH7_9FIRM|nr:o-succinylbenzoate synthase [Calderihabitans maritimus]GAW91783.1 O-succinylbenzoate synthase [Calderihabitans maritimus]